MARQLEFDCLALFCGRPCGQADEGDTKDSLDEVEQVVNRIVDAKLSLVKNEISAKLEACAASIHADVSSALYNGPKEVRPMFPYFP